MNRIVVRPRLQSPDLVATFTVWTLLGVTYFTSGDVAAEGDWFGIVLGCLFVTSGMAGIWRALRLGVGIGGEGVRVRGFDDRDRVPPWSSIQPADCMQSDAGRLATLCSRPSPGCDADAMPLSVVGSYSRQDAEHKGEQLRSVSRPAP